MEVSLISALNVSTVCKFLLFLPSLQQEVLPLLFRKMRVSIYVQVHKVHFQMHYFACACYIYVVVNLLLTGV